MNFYDNNPTFINSNSTQTLVCGTSCTETITLGFTLSDKDWMPYDFFEYIPVWHEKYARIKYQMEKMWD